MIFVFGSNTAGRHGKGAALYARQHHGAIYGQGYGLQGNSFGIPTRDGTPKKIVSLSLEEIEGYVKQFIEFARANPSMKFRLTPIGCNHAGYTPAQIGPMFKGSPSNVLIPKEFEPYVNM